ncbi:hypothetical protein [Comamonas odontotermitis]|uniref:hypothetical protein n=1 Tax=Comamonas odontotermitis TaxID=379895 RepID=UPI001CC62100|nr:hypothetical protein [Comamonas odontotermitis]UBB16853.1 hypothetical protein LAD35_19030 [Comamonas odontotermitis]
MHFNLKRTAFQALLRRWFTWTATVALCVVPQVHATSFKAPEIQIDLSFAQGVHDVSDALQRSLEQQLRQLKAKCKTKDEPIFIVEGGGLISPNTVSIKTQRTRAVRVLIERMGFDPAQVYEAIQSTSPSYAKRDAPAVVQVQFTCVS